MHKTITLIIFSLGLNAALAQQEPQYTQFMFNKLAYNPGYAGSFVSPALTVIYRNQWMGIDGAPKTQILTYNQPLVNERIGIGGTLTRNSIGITRSFTFDIVYSYRIPMRRGHLSLGVMPSIRQYWQNWNDERLYSSTPISTDIAIPNDAKNKTVFNLGFGAYFSNDHFFAGASAPRMIPANIDFEENGAYFSKEELHLNAMAGFTLKPNDALKIIPQVLLKYVLHAPFDADVNVSALLHDKFYGGLSYRLGGDTNGAGESLDVMAGVQATKNLFFCLSYDIGFTRLRKFSNGSIEATARWWFNPPEGTAIDSGRGDF